MKSIKTVLVLALALISFFVFSINADAAEHTEYKVKKGDSIWKIAKRNDLSTDFLCRYNKKAGLVKKCRLIYIGQTILVPVDREVKVENKKIERNTNKKAKVQTESFNSNSSNTVNTVYRKGPGKNKFTMRLSKQHNGDVQTAVRLLGYPEKVGHELVKKVVAEDYNDDNNWIHGSVIHSMLFGSGSKVNVKKDVVGNWRAPHYNLTVWEYKVVADGVQYTLITPNPKIYKTWGRGYDVLLTKNRQPAKLVKDKKITVANVKEITRPVDILLTKNRQPAKLVKDRKITVANVKEITRPVIDEQGAIVLGDNNLTLEKDIPDYFTMTVKVVASIDTTNPQINRHMKENVSQAKVVKDKFGKNVWRLAYQDDPKIFIGAEILAFSEKFEIKKGKPIFEKYPLAQVDVTGEKALVKIPNRYKNRDYIQPVVLKIRFPNGFIASIYPDEQNFSAFVGYNKLDKSNIVWVKIKNSQKMLDYVSGVDINQMLM